MVLMIKKWNLPVTKKENTRKSYLAVKLGKTERYDMVHTENFVLVDAKKKVRGFYDGTNKEDIKKLIIDINFLSNE
jgi:protein SCO1/2